MRTTETEQSEPTGQDRPSRPGRRRRRAIGLAALAAVTAVAVAVAAGTWPDETGTVAREEPRSSSEPTPTETGPLPPAEPCLVGGPGVTTLQMTVRDAKTLTTAAVDALDAPRPRQRLARAVMKTLGEPPGVAAGVASSMLAGRDALPLSCAHLREDVKPERRGPSGLTPRAVKVRRAWTNVFGPLPAGGFSSSGVSSGHVDNSAHYEGRAVDVFFTPADSPETRRKGWVFAQWIVARAADYHVLSVIYADRIWTMWASSSGWRDYVHPSGDTRNAVLRHLDHVHVAVESGRRWKLR